MTSYLEKQSGGMFVPVLSVATLFVKGRDVLLPPLVGCTMESECVWSTDSLVFSLLAKIV
jgi:hypothetical protein